MTEQDIIKLIQKCPKFDKGCYKIDMVMDKDILDSQASVAIISVCSKCENLEKVK
jgi:hypothetical protein